MALYYLETSALVKLYVREPGTEVLLRLASRSSDSRLAVLSLARVELTSAVRRRERNGEIPAAVATSVLEAFGRHLQTRFVTQIITDFVLDIAVALANRHALRAFDAVQLAGFVALRAASSSTEAPFFVCSDKALLTAAETEGAAVLNPES